MTGEITLRGRVLPVGGIREKVLAAHRAGLKTVILPQRNQKDLVDVPKRARNDLKLVPVDHVDQVLDIALLPDSTTDSYSSRKKRSSPRKSDEKPHSTKDGASQNQPGLPL